MSINDHGEDAWGDPRILTKSLWLDEEFKHLKPSDYGLKEFHGRFHPEIPYQMMLRYTKEGETVWDCFAGGGTTIDVGKELGRKVIANDIYPWREDIIVADSRRWCPFESTHLVIMHPPYWDMIKFGESGRDLSSAKSAEEWSLWLGQVVDNVVRVLESGRYLVLVISDVYKDGQQWPLDALAYKQIVQRGFRLKGRIVKNFGETKGTEKSNPSTRNLWRYRAIKFGFWDLGLDWIWVYQKKGP